jgi:hypothetical protein
MRLIPAGLIALAAFLRSPGGRPNLHGSDLGQPAPLGSTFALRGRDRTGAGDGGRLGVMDEPPGVCLRRWQGGQVPQIGAATPARTASGRTRLGVEPECSERLATDAAKSLLHRHKTLSI